jgi:hypothetical protein
VLKLIKSELRPMTPERLLRMRNDAHALTNTPQTEVRAAYDMIEAVRDALSQLLDKVDGKHV